jgi:inhibitor of KinA sporulation pathway (predicted exonuclease)
MAKRLDQILVVDLECTCWEGEPPPGETGEIIEIGICLLDANTLTRSAKESILVRPERSQVSPFCTHLTTLTQEQVERGVPFAQACQKLRKEYNAGDRTWASYGDYDRRQFERQCQETNVFYPFGKTHLNVKNLASIALNEPYELGMDKALQRLNIPLEGTHHRGVDDAWNIAQLLALLLSKLRANHHHQGS